MQSRGDPTLNVALEYRIADEGPGNGTVLNGRGHTLGELLVAEYGPLMTYSRRLTANGPEARDLVQMVCARVLSQGAEMVKPDNLSAWLRTALFRLFVDFKRRSRREIPTHLTAAAELALTPHVEDVEPEFHCQAVKMVTVDDVRSLLTNLPAHYRVPYEMFSFDGMSYEQISSRLGLPSRTVGSRINRARKKLRSLLQARYS